MNNNRFCTQKGHEQVQTTLLCMFEDCRLLQRQCCINCIKEGIHNHGKDDQEHIKLEQLPYNKNIKPIDLSKREYKVKEIDRVVGYLTADISNNEKYLAYGGFKQILIIYGIKEDRIIKELETNGRISAINFSFDSSQLYVAFWNNIQLNILIGFDVEKNFKQIFGQCVITFPWEIKSIIAIQKKYLITFGSGKIRKIDIKKNKQIFKLFDNIQTIDQQYDMIISGSYKGSIKLWDFGKRRTIINQEKAHYGWIEQIQFINNIQNVLSLDQKHNLYKWSVDLINKTLVKLQEYQDPNGIQNFCSINQNQNLLLTCGCYVKIVDNKGQAIKQIDFMCGDDSQCQSMRYRQLDNAKYIYVVTRGDIYQKPKIILLSALEQYQMRIQFFENIQNRLIQNIQFFLFDLDIIIFKIYEIII